MCDLKGQDVAREGNIEHLVEERKDDHKRLVERPQDLPRDDGERDVGDHRHHGLGPRVKTFLL